MEYYAVPQSFARVLIVQAAKTAVACVLFYAAIRVNLYLFLRYRILKSALPSAVDWLVIAIIALLFLIQLLLTYMKTSRAEYLFFADRIELPGRWVVMYRQIRQAVPSSGRIDRVFRTGSVSLGKGLVIEHVKSPQELAVYIERLAGIAPDEGTYRVY